MKASKILTKIPILIIATLLAGGCATNTQMVALGEQNKTAAKQQESASKTAKVIKGKLLGISQKAMTITIKGPNGSVLVQFDGDTNGLKYLKKNDALIVNFKTSGKNKIATDIKPKLAKLPKGILEIQPEELATIVGMGPLKGNYMLIDARPKGAYAKGHIPTAISIPVAQMKKNGKNLLPQDSKDTLLVFYCGGPT